MNILVVEDDTRIARLLHRGLTEDGHHVVHSSNGQDGLYCAQERRFDVIILDILLPVLDGFSLLRQLRQGDCGTPVLILTARDAMADVVQGLDLGADDYLTKPFLLEVLLARVRALGRRGAESRPVDLRMNDLLLDRGQKRAARANRLIPLTKKEYLLLEALMKRSGQVISRNELIEAGWGFETEARDSSLDFYMHSLRNKIDGPGEPRMLRTLRGLGYQLSVAALNS